MRSLFKRALPELALLLVTLVVLLASTFSSAHAEWKRTELPWVRLNYSNYLNPTNPPDTSWTTAAASKVDTTAAFTLDAADNPHPYLENRVSATADSTWMARLVFYSDSTVASTVSFKASTCKLQINFSDNAANWQDLVTYTSAQTDGTKNWVVPLYVAPVTPASITNDLGPDLNIPLVQVGAKLRAIFTGGASVAVPALRSRVVTWQDFPSRPEGER